MPTPAQPTPSPAGDDRDPVTAQQTPVDVGFDEKLRLFWAKYSAVVLGVCALILLVIVGRYGWEWFQERQAAERAEAYAAASSDDQLRSFAAEHGETTLGGVAQLRLADSAYEEGRWADAQGAYERARDALQGTPLSGRARLGAAMAMLKNDQPQVGRTALQALVDDSAAEAAIRAEAAYHLASLASAEGASAEVARLVEQITAIDPTGLWAQRAMMLARTMPPAEATASPAPAAEAPPATEAPAVSFPNATP